MWGTAGIFITTVGAPGCHLAGLLRNEGWLSTAGGPDTVGGPAVPHTEAAGTTVLSHFTDGTINNLAKVTKWKRQPSHMGSV